MTPESLKPPRSGKSEARKPQQERREPGGRVFPARWVLWLVPVLIALVTFAAFLPTLQNQFVNWDDAKNLLDNPHYRGLGWTQLRWMWTAFHMGHYLPLTWMTFGLDYLLWGLKPVGYHLTNLLLHAANAVVFYFVARRLLGLALRDSLDQGRVALAFSAGFAALLFALHPLRVESVAWATERRDVLSGLFYLLTILVYLRACGTMMAPPRLVWFWGAVGLFACALLSKSMAVSLPVVLLILDVFPLRRLGGARGWWSEPARRVYLEKSPFALLAAAASAIAFLALVHVQNLTSLEQLSALGRLAISAYSLSFYLWKMVVPVNLSPLYELGTVNPWATPFLLSYGAGLALTAFAVACRRRAPGLPAAWLAYVVILLPVLGVFQNGPQIAADRYTYLAELGWAILAGAVVLSCWQAWRVPLTGLAIGVLLGLGVLTWNQVQVWHDPGTLWTHARAMDPQSSIAENNVGAVLEDQGRLAEAIDHYRLALQVKPDYALAHKNLGGALAREGSLVEAIEHYQEALRIDPHYADAHNNWGVALAQQGRLAEAIDHYRQALRTKPDFATAHYNWGIALAKQGDLAEAGEHYQQALHFKPDYADAHNNLGKALARQGNLAEAIDHYRQALRIKPDYADVYNNWGNALAKDGKPAEAIDHYRQALQIKPDYADAHYNWGNALARQGKLAEAIEHYQKALHLKPDHSDAHNSWGAALAQQGKLAEAIDHYQQALQIKPDFADAHNNWGAALGQQGKLAEASDHFRQALRIRPDHAAAQSNLLNALQALGTGKEDAAPSRTQR